MKERPIIFKPELVRAILDGRKMVTRRPVKLPKHNVNAIYFSDQGDCEDSTPSWFADDISDGRFEPAECFASTRIRCPYGRVGDRLWVRETWQRCRECGGHGFVGQPPELDQQCANCGGSGFVYRASTSEARKYSWKPSIHMPRRASRLTLEVTDIRAERLQNITEEDAKLEGVEPFPPGANQDFDPGDCWSACNNPGREHLAAFEYKWNEIHGWNPNSWASNPWVWRVAFKVVETADVEAEIRRRFR